MRRLGILFLSVVIAVALFAAPAQALPIQIVVLDIDPAQDPLGLLGEVHELGDGFPLDELIASDSLMTEETACTAGPEPDDPQIPNILVTMANLSPFAWSDVHYVADPLVHITNYDGMIGNPDLEDFGLAFRIDNLGVNTPLVFESLIPDNIFQVGETWEFIIQDYQALVPGLPPTPFGSPGIGLMSLIDQVSSGSILAVKVPAEQCDYGDAPDSYGTTLASDGARHAANGNLWMGPMVDWELDGQPSAPADADDLNPSGAPDDEDGVILPPILTPGSSPAFTVTLNPGIPGYLDAWIDFNGDGVFAHPGELIVSLPLPPGPSLVPFTVPNNAIPGLTYARFRLSTQGLLSPTGPADDGEVDDYLVEIEEAPTGTIIVEKQTDPDGSGQGFEFTTSYGPNFFLTDDQTADSGPLPPGLYSIGEVNIPAGWTLTSAISSDGSDPGAIGLDPGETVVVTFTNTEEGGGSLAIPGMSTWGAAAAAGLLSLIGILALRRRQASAL